MSKGSNDGLMNLANMKIQDEQSIEDCGIKLNILDDGSKGTIYDLLKLPELVVKRKN